METLPNKSLAGVCGVFCNACAIYQYTQQNNEAALNLIAQRMNVPQDAIRCTGCRTSTKTAYCSNCHMIRCASGKGLEFCGECPDFPCKELEDFKSKMPHRVEIYESLERIKQAGWETWYTEMMEHFTCPGCHKINGWYDIQCKSCSHDPGSPFANKHREVLSTRKPL